ncbi:MAG: DNA primase noncatalytic subunit PriX [Candidatus Nitrosopolaris sp.]
MITAANQINNNVDATINNIILDGGLDFIIDHFEEPIWSRTVSTYTTQGRQVLVHSKAEAIAIFKQANLLDCRINAYPYYTGFGGINRQSPNFIFIDLDLHHFNSMKALDRALRNVLKNIKEKFNGAQATVIRSGNGYHIYLPIQAFILELESVFSEFEEPSKKFLRFSEKMLSNDKADPCHSNNLSFKNCMLRIPGSHNSECVKRNNNFSDSTTEVKIIQKWDGNRPAINWLLRDFRRYLIQEKIDNSVIQRKRTRSSPNRKTTPTKRMWIEILLDTPIEDYRKEAIRRIIAPYLINIRKLAYDDAFDVIRNWLTNCDKERPLDFNTNIKIKDALRAATRVGYLHIGFSDLKSENGELYRHISNRIGEFRGRSFE